jgi:hypothetical protein
MERILLLLFRHISLMLCNYGSVNGARSEERVAAGLRQRAPSELGAFYSGPAAALPRSLAPGLRASSELAHHGGVAFARDLKPSRLRAI